MSDHQPNNAEKDVDEAAWDAAVRLDAEAAALLGAGKPDDAEKLARRAVEELATILPEGHPDVASALNTLATAQLAVGRVRDALETWRESLALVERNSNEEQVQRLRVPILRNAASALLQVGDYVCAGEAIDLAISEALRLDGEWDLDGADGYNLLGVFYKMQGRFDQAAKAYQRAGQIFERAAVAPSLELMHNLGGLACAQGNYQRAANLLREAIARRREEDGNSTLATDTFASRDPKGLAGDLAGLADALVGQRQLDAAVGYYKEALETLRGSGFEGNPEVAYCLHNLGDAYAELGRFDEAERCYRESLARKEELFGRDHHEVAATLANLASLMSETGRREEMRLFLQRACSIADRLAADHPVQRGCKLLAARHGLG